MPSRLIHSSMRRLVRSPRSLRGSRSIVIAAVCACASTVLPLRAAAADVTPGEYLTEGGWGMLHVTRDASGMRSFAIDSEGPNGHSCSVRGGIVAGKAVLAEQGDDEPCAIAFDAHGDAVDVSLGAPATCREYCGARAGFDGRYVRPADGCRTDQRLAFAATFMQAYRAARYDVALRTLQPLLTKCTTWLDARARGRLIEDIAITQYHLGRFDDCLATLEPLRADAERSAADLDRAYQGLPADVEQASEQAGETRTNLALCRRGGKTS